MENGRPVTIANYSRLPPPRGNRPPPYAELMVASNFSFLHGASHPPENSVAQSRAAIGLAGIGPMTATRLPAWSLGHLEAKQAAKDHPGFRYVVGTRLVFADGTPDIVTYPTNLAAYDSGSVNC